MKARLASWCLGTEQECGSGTGSRPLEALSTRESSDFSIALLDAWSTVADVLTFYQERVANEGYLRTATERRSVLELARLVGYRLRPGVASSVFLAYTIDENTKEEVVIPSGARTQSVPGPGELPQVFETDDDLKARAAWNNLKPRQTQPQTLDAILKSFPMRVYLQGVSTGLKPNDPLLIDPGTGRPLVFRVLVVDPDSGADRTRVEMQEWIAPLAVPQRLAALRAALRDLTDNAPRGAIAGRAVEEIRVVDELAESNTPLEALTRTIRRNTLPALASMRAEAERITTASRLTPWLRTAEETIDALVDDLESGAAPSPPANVRIEDGQGAIVEQLELLTKARSQPRSGPLQLPRDLKTSFLPTSDSGLKVLQAVRPELRSGLAQVLATYALAAPAPELKVYALRQRAGLFGRNFPKRQRVVKSGQGSEESTETQIIGEWPIVLSVKAADPNISDLDVEKTTESTTTVFLDASYDGILPDSWVLLDFSAVPNFVATGETHQVTPRPFLVGTGTTAALPFLLTKATGVQAKASRGEYGGSGDTTRIALDREWLAFTAAARKPAQEVVDRDFQVIRGTAAYAQSELLTLAEEPIDIPLCGGAASGQLIELNGLYSELEPGRFVIVSGERADIPHTTGVLASETAMLAEVHHDVRDEEQPIPRSTGGGNALPGDRKHTFIRLDRALSYCYTRRTVVIHGNVVKATHGETRAEVLGSGDGSRAFQSFTLKQRPLTFLAAPTPAGAVSTLRVYVNDVRWHEVEDLSLLGPSSHDYATASDDDDRTSAVFGDGRHGARLPTGLENVRAIYRSGIGTPGNVRPNQISILSTRPLGVKEVVNPLRASGGADREGRDQARANVPTIARALDRLVSVRDYQDFARTFAGIGKAAAVELTDGFRTVVHVTIAGAGDIPIDESSDLIANLRRALTDFGDPLQPVTVAVRELLLVVMSAGVRIEPDYLWEPVATDIRTALTHAFGFERRSLGQDVTRSEVIEVMQRVRGVAYVDLDILGAIPESIGDPEAAGGRRLQTPEEIAAAVADIALQQPVHRVPVGMAQFVGPAAGIRPGQLALLSPDVPDTLVLNQLSQRSR